MAEDWDLYAVVRSCAAAGTTDSAAETESESHLGCLGSLVFEDDGGDFGFPDLERPRNNAFEELNQFYRPFFPVAGDGSVSDSGGFGFGFESEVYEPQRKRQRVLESVDSVSLFGAKRRTPCVQLPQQIHQQQQREAYHRGTHENAAGTSGSFTAAPPQISPRLRKRKSQQKRMVCEVTAENLSSDLWAWRKYGQKPIKGSPYPRNYYRCSSSKGCAARKQVEKSTTDPNVFIVTYTGDHIHPRPTHRNSLAGSTRNKISGAARPAGAARNPSCSSPLSAASLSPRTPLTSPVDEAPAKAEEGGNDVADDVEDDDLLIPNTAMTEDIFMGLQELGYGSGFGHRRPKLEPSWTAAAAGGSAAAGGGC